MPPTFCHLGVNCEFERAELWCFVLWVALCSFSYSPWTTSTGRYTCHRLLKGLHHFFMNPLLMHKIECYWFFLKSPRSFNLVSVTTPLKSSPTAFWACSHFCFKNIFLKKRSLSPTASQLEHRRLLHFFCVRHGLISPSFSRHLHPCSSEEPGSLSRTAEESGASKGEHLPSFLFFSTLTLQWACALKL